MEAQELRLGNYVIVNHKTDLLSKVISIQPDFISVEYNRQPDLSNGVIIPAKQLIPIPLSEHWITSLEFRYSMSKDKYYVLDKHNIAISTADDKYRVIMGNFVCSLVICEIEHVHQLQNVVFALTQQELIYKP